MNYIRRPAWVLDSESDQSLWNVLVFAFLLFLAPYMILVQNFRYRRMRAIAAPFAGGKRPLSSMTTKEAHDIIAQLQELEFPAAFSKARKIALLKAGGIPTMSKLFAVTGQNTTRNAGKRTVDTEILLRETQCQYRDSDRYAAAVARMNYLHARYRKAGKITDDDLLHTLGDGMAEISRIIAREEWRSLTAVEMCAIGIFHKNLGEDMGIPFGNLPSAEDGWRSGEHFTRELEVWTHDYEKKVCEPTSTNDQYVRVYVDSAFRRMPKFVARTVRQILADNLDDVMRTSLCLEATSPFLRTVLAITRSIRILLLRYLFLPRTRRVKLVDEFPNPKTQLYNSQRMIFQPWYVKPTFWSTWGPSAWLIRALGGLAPGAQGDRFQPQGYDLKTIGPDPQKGKGIEDMIFTMDGIKAKGVASCPFSQSEDGRFRFSS